ncbi:prolyl 4-hydroxylase subunit alpha-2-like [Drosophila ficusphila]|uniref:prolyl 4-hydroxylase subunit alpha-2-like n=1 Tax=Drosophila ficusphila TaxID=30025 RepID=UPI001C8A95F5|nr:prolyl 4-hydroxylase subunit alpha-2-like [Drosophila ficusphila]
MLIRSLVIVGVLFFSSSWGELLKKPRQQHYSRSVMNMDVLLKMDDALVGNLEKFADELLQKAKTIRRGIHEMRKRHKNYNPSEQFWASPLKSYSLIRHMQADWLMWQVYLEKPVGQEELRFLDSNKTSLPQDHDIADAAHGIKMLQRTYGMMASDIARGLLDGVQYDSSLAPVDCLAIAHHLMNQSIWSAAEPWILSGLEAVDLQTEMESLRGPTKALLHRTLGEVRMKQGNHKGALQAYQVALKLSPHDSEVFQEYQSLENRILSLSEIGPLEEEPDDPDESDNFPPCCSGRCEVVRKLRRMYCVYNHVTAPFLRLAPIKTEILSTDPFMAILHDMVTPKESALLRSSSRDYLWPSATVPVDDFSNTSLVDRHRTSMSASLDDDFNEGTLKLCERLGDATGLHVNYSDVIQVVNYGLGGYFQMHFDLLLSKNARFNGTEDRMSTTLFYLNDVPQGGGTYFPELNITVFPSFGSALFWYNLDWKGNDHMKSMHTGCPVIVGSKWVVTKWVYDMGQEFRRPCIDSKSSTKALLSLEKLII